MHAYPQRSLSPGEIVEARLVEMVFPGQTNHYGTLFGGQALALMDKAAFVVASRYARRTVVTRSSDQVDFRVAVKQGHLVELVGTVVATGRTSITVDVELFAEDLLTGARELATRGRFVFVAVDEDMRPVPVPRFAGAHAPVSKPHAIDPQRHEDSHDDRQEGRQP